MEIKLGKQALAAIAAAAAREGLSVEEFVIDAALRKAGVRGETLDQEALLVLVERAKTMAEALSVDAMFRMKDLVEDQPWWNELPAASRQEMSKLFRQTMQQQTGFIEFTSRDAESSAIYMRVA